MNYTVFIVKSAKKQIIKLPAFAIKEIYKKLKELETTPFPYGYKKLSGFENLYRIRVGQYRIIYYVDNNILTITVVKIGHRKDVYRL